MARVTVEDCLKDVDNLFQLVLIASKRARQIYNGSAAQVPLEGDKPTVLALREIAKGFVGRGILKEKREEIVIDEELLEAEMASVSNANLGGSALDPSLS